MTRRCSHCSNNGHNSRTCPNRGVKLFGVRLIDGSMKKSASMGNLNLSSAHFASSAAVSPNHGSPSSDPIRDSAHGAGGYVSDDPAHASCSSNCRGERKKGTPWTEEEHRLFLMGLQKLGKGDWRGIARNFVISRTPTQVASHAQKYFIRQINSTRRKRRSSLFDMVPDMSIDPPTVPEEPEPFLLHSSQQGETEHVNLLPPVNLSLDQESEPMEMTSNETPTEEGTSESSNFPSIIPAFYPTYIPIPFPFWPQNLSAAEEEKGGVISRHEILKPKPIFSKDTINVDELVGMSKLTIGEAANGRIEPSPLSMKLIGAPSRQSAFHANPPVNRSNLNKTKCGAMIHAV